jgi:hypothetical protein
MDVIAVNMDGAACCGKHACEKVKQVLFYSEVFMHAYDAAGTLVTLVYHARRNKRQ